MTARDVAVYRSKRVVDMYLYVDETRDLMSLPEDLLKRFGRPVETMRFKLAANRSLARADAKLVLEAIASQGFYLQLPPTLEDRSRDES
jgi:hypothetical protein|tara:strand:+ start:690 stop:956 length:267 start_codon:yes stop_codon:yes gene_type:complete